MRIAKLPIPNADHLATAGLATVGSGVASWIFLMRRLLSGTDYGPICGHESLLGPHCQACYGALGLAGAGLGLLIASEALRVAPRAPRLAR